MATSKNFRLEPLLLIIMSLCLSLEGGYFFGHLVMELKLHATIIPLIYVIMGKLIEVAK